MLKGLEVYGNIIMYIRVTASSSFGNKANLWVTASKVTPYNGRSHNGVG